MRLRLLLAGLLLLAGCGGVQQKQSGLGQSTPATAGPASQATAAPWGADPNDLAKGPMLFVVEAPGGPVYLFGTMHTEPASSMPKPAADRLAAARDVAFEVDMENVDPMKMVVRASLPAGQSLDALVGPEAWSRITSYLQGLVPGKALVQFRPWLVFTLIMTKAMGLAPGAEVMDLALLKRSRTAGKQVKFLESMDEQIAALEKLIDAKMLIEITKEIDQLPAVFKHMTEAYRAGDLAALESLLQAAGQSTEASPHMRELFGVRNKRWIPFIEGLADRGGGFIAFGAGHLPGQDGVVALLRLRGHTVKRVLAGP